MPNKFRLRRIIVMVQFAVYKYFQLRRALFFFFFFFFKKKKKKKKKTDGGRNVFENQLL